MAPAAAEPNDIPKLVADSPVSDPADPEALNSDAPTPAEQPGFIRAQFCGLKELARRLYTRARTAITYNLNTDVFEIIEVRCELNLCTDAAKRRCGSLHMICDGLT